jgi:hypothetical protein
MTVIKLPDALVKALQDRHVQTLEDMETFVSEAAWEKLQEEGDNDRQLTDAEIELLRRRLAQAEHGEVYSLEEFTAMMKVNKEKILAEISTNK